MKAVVSASVTAPAAIRGSSSAAPRRRPSPAAAARPRPRSRPRTGSPVRGSTMWSPLRTPEAPSAVWRTERRASTRDGAAGIAQRQRPAVAARRRLECEDGAEAAVDERALEPPLLEQFRHQIDRVALADAAEVDLHPVRRRANQEVVGVQLERRQPRADRDVERAAGQVEHVARDDEALQRRRADPCALARRQMVDPRDVAVGAEAAQLALEAVRRDRRRPAPPAPRTVRRGARRTPRRRWPSPRARSAARRASSRGPAIPSPPSTSGPPARMKESGSEQVAGSSQRPLRWKPKSGRAVYSDQPGR